MYELNQSNAMKGSLKKWKRREVFSFKFKTKNFKFIRLAPLSPHAHFWTEQFTLLLDMHDFDIGYAQHQEPVP